MKRSFIGYLIFLNAVFLCLACSVKKDRLINRGFNAMTAKYNILYNGDLAYQEALKELEDNYFDNYWEILPLERINLDIDPTKEFQKGMSLDSKTTSVLDNFAISGVSSSQQEDSLDHGSGFERAENKATKAIQKHSMYINGRERNWEMDNAYLLLGKSRYYDGRYIPALEAFNYIMYKYPDGAFIDQTIIWREKTNLRLAYEDIAIKNLKELLVQKKGRLSKKDESDANAVLSQAYINIEQYDNAIASLKRAIELCRDVKTKARYLFVLGQLYVKVGKKAEAYHAFSQVIDFNRRVPRIYRIQSFAQQFALENLSARDSLSFLRKYTKLLEDRENRAYLDILNRQVGLFYQEIGNDKQALKYLKQAVKQYKVDTQLKANNYLNIAEIYFNNSGYAQSGSYYDSALAILPGKYKDRFRIEKRRDALRDVVAYEKTAKTNDSILALVGMSTDQRHVYFQNYIDQLRKEDFKKLQATLKQKNRNDNVDYFNITSFGDAINKSLGDTNNQMTGKSSFYFYSSQATLQGENEFKRKWGNRLLEDNWKWASSKVERKSGQNQEQQVPNEQQSIGEPLDNRYNLEYYLSTIPSDPAEIEKLKKDRDFAYFQLGSMYSDRFKKYDLAAQKLEDLLTFDPAQRLVLPAMYKLYKIYLETDPVKAQSMKSNIIGLYPDSRYAKLLQNVSRDLIDDLSPEQRYTQVYRIYQTGDIDKAYDAVQDVLENYDNDFISMFELLKAQIVAQKFGLQAYKEALNFVALTYSSTPEGKKAEELLETVVSKLEARDFSNSNSNNWKIVVYTNENEGINDSLIQREMINFAMINKEVGITYSQDPYQNDGQFLVIHGFKSEQDALKAIERLALIGANAISGENYKIVLINQKWEEYKNWKTNK
ncbi:type IX secretion system periplasmic lipoprotein PorW/SprE [Myroides sp. LJL110]